MTNKKEIWVDPSAIDQIVQESIALENIHCDCCVAFDLKDIDCNFTEEDLNKLKPFTGRLNAGKPKLSYNSIGLESNEGLARVWEFGSTKYGRASWLKGYKWTEVLDSLLRHVDKFSNGEDLDDESGLPHVDHIQANAKILSQMFHIRPDLDDRGMANEN